MPDKSRAPLWSSDREDNATDVDAADAIDVVGGAAELPPYRWPDVEVALQLLLLLMLLVVDIFGLMRGGTTDVMARILRIFDRAIVLGGIKRLCPANVTPDADDDDDDVETDVATDV